MNEQQALPRLREPWDLFSLSGGADSVRAKLVPSQPNFFKA
jgi:hypothetical protein